MIDLEKQKQRFKNHIATFTDYGNIKILDFKNPNSSDYRIRFLFEEDYYRLHISGDLGELIASNYHNMVYEHFSDFVNDVGYFEDKIDCHNRDIYYYDEEKARKEIYDYLNEYGFLAYYEDDDEHEVNDLLDEILEDFDDNNGISKNGYERLSEIDQDAWEVVNGFGKTRTGILELYMLAFDLAQNQLRGDRNESI